MNTAIDRKRLFKILAFIIVLLCLVNLIAEKFYWYYSIWWFDMPMHFLGGLFIGFTLIWFLTFKDFVLEVTFSSIFKIFLGILIAGVSWEIFEILFNNIIAQNQFNILDTVSDVFFDLAGGAFAIFYFFKKIVLKKEITL